MSRRRLHPTLPHLAGEAATSFASRLAQRHSGENGGVRSFCADMGIDFREVVDGQPDALIALGT